MYMVATDKCFAEATTPSSSPLRSVGDMQHLQSRVSGLQRLVETLQRQLNEKHSEIEKLSMIRQMETGEKYDSGMPACEESEALRARLAAAEVEASQLRHRSKVAEENFHREIEATRRHTSELEALLYKKAQVSETVHVPAKHEDVNRLEHLLLVQNQQLQSLRESHRQRDEEASEYKERLKEVIAELENRDTIAARKAHEFLLTTLQQQEDQQRRQIHDMLNRQGASLMGLANRHVEGRERELEHLTFELDKKDRVLASLRDELRKREEVIFLLRSQLDDLQAQKFSAETGKIAAVAQQQANADAKVALNTAELQSRKVENEILQERFSQIEEEMKEKDNEIRDFQKRCSENDLVMKRMEREINSLEFEMNMKDVQLAEMEKAGLNREGELANSLRRQKEEQDEVIRFECLKHEKVATDRLEIIRHLQQEIVGLNERVGSAQLEIHKLLLVVTERDRKINQLQNQIMEQETALQLNNRNSEIELLKKGECELKRRLQEQLARCEYLQQDAVILQRTRGENVTLQKEIVDLRVVISRLNERLANVRRGATNDWKINNGSSENRLANRSLEIQKQSGDSGSWLAPSIERPATVGPKDYQKQGKDPYQHDLTSPTNVGARERDRDRESRSKNKISSNAGYFDHRSEYDCLRLPMTGRCYDPRPVDSIDQMMAQYINTNQDTIPFQIRRLDDGLYLFGTKRTHVKLINGQLMVQLGSSLMNVADYIASERYSLYPADDRQKNFVAVPRRNHVARAQIVNPFSTAAAIPEKPQGRVFF